MEAADREVLVRDADQFVAPPNGGINELLNVDQEENAQEQEFLGPQADVYMGLLQMQLILHYDMTYREVKYSNLGLEDIDHKMLMGINVTPIIGLLYTPVLIRFLGTKWMMFLASGIYALFVSTNYWERYYTLVPSAVAIGVAIVPLWASLGNYITRMAQQYYEYVNYREEHVQEQKKLPKGACHSYIIVFQSIFFIIFHLSFVFAEFPMRFVLNGYLRENEHILKNVHNCGANIKGVIPGFNTTVLSKLPRSMLLIQVESVLMGFAFLSMIIFLVLCGAAYRPTEEIDLRSIGWGNIFQLPFKHLRDYRLRLLCPFFIYSGFEQMFAITGFSLTPSYLGPLLVISVLWGLGSALNKTGVSILLGMLYGEEKERLDFVFTIYHWWQAIAIFIVYLWSNMPMRAKLSIVLATLLLACFCYGVMERRLARKIPFRLPRIPRPRHKVKGYRYLEEDNSDESDSERSDDEEDEEGLDDDEHVAEEMEAEDGDGGGQDAGGPGAESPGARRRGAEGQHHRGAEA
ncbi:Protein unc-93 like B1 [Dissostichus eleginoides]|uniref:Protein unc-93 like B1 n=1 Tax=Dissostichus eleginoides TaxID=100907 RepID=A0AAD9BLM7_DISEL|nr:Protein unc-93 like B1 [Dissostichus eleginoides]